jgi:PilZ domain
MGMSLSIGDLKMQKMLKAYQADGPRKILLKGAQISFQDTSVGCFVLNISTGGAGLVLDSDVPIPFSFELEIDGARTRRRCLVVWRNDCHLGVSFDLDRRSETELNRS